MKIAVASGKGGVGKSMLASVLAMLFAQDRNLEPRALLGFKAMVVAVDCDVDAPNLHLWLGQKEDWDEVEKISTNEKPVIDYKKCNLCGKCVDTCAFGALSFSQKSLNSKSLILNPFFCEGCGACEVVCPQKAIRMVPVQNAEIRIRRVYSDDCHPERSEGSRRDSSPSAQNDISSGISFPLVSAQLYPGETGSGKIVDQIVARAEKFDYEIMILDSPAGTGCPVIAALKDANFAVLVTEPTPSGRSDLQRVLRVVEHFQIPFGVVINKWDINPSLTLRINNEFKDQTLGKISYDKKIFQAIANLQPILATNLPVKNEIKEIYAKLKNRL